mgnify:CR=1 FL=1
MDPLGCHDHPVWGDRSVGTKVPDLWTAGDARRSADLEFGDHSGIAVTRDAAEQDVGAGFKLDAAGCVLVGQRLEGEVVDSLDAEIVVDGSLVAKEERRLAIYGDSGWRVCELGRSDDSGSRINRWGVVATPEGDGNGKHDRHCQPDDDRD